MNLRIVEFRTVKRPGFGKTPIRLSLVSCGLTVATSNAGALLWACWPIRGVARRASPVASILQEQPIHPYCTTHRYGSDVVISNYEDHRGNLRPAVSGSQALRGQARSYVSRSGRGRTAPGDFARNQTEEAVQA